ncbi:zinc finger BED domain-containing protein RICESLEEPER 2-like [Senna tora]|uniref:Zinc finger BED domain-containing protein RICESLEEPER 2-like n=1 Tax=Senna tora TaxID=362788 RepID=A0A834SHD0_9FABA|nr:zinc finger BED domain-containing protein RICESLEEPER 2-like [Senna tora]
MASTNLSRPSNVNPSSDSMEAEQDVNLGGVENLSKTEAEQPTRKKKKLISKVWLQMTKLDDGSAKCHHCKKVFVAESSKGTSHLSRHLTVCKKRELPDIRKFSRLANATNEDGTISLGTWTYDWDSIRRSIANFLICAKLTFSIVELLAFKEMIDNLTPQREQVEGIVETLKGSMAFWPFGSGGRYGTSKEKGEIFVGMRGTTDKVDVVRVMGTGWLRWLANDVGSLGTSLPRTECFDHIVPRPQAFFTKAYVPMECKPHEAEMEMREKELLVSSPLPHGQAISFKIKLRVGGSIILDEIRDFESGGDFHLREYTKVLLLKLMIIPFWVPFLRVLSSWGPLDFLFLDSRPLAAQVFEELIVCHTKVRQMLVAMLLDLLPFIGGIALDVSSLNW